jgi:hypothetical protein
MCTETIVPISIETMPHKDRGKQLQQYEIRISSTGIMPLARNQVLKRLPQAKQEPALQDINHALTNTINDMLGRVQTTRTEHVM